MRRQSASQSSIPQDRSEQVARRKSSPHSESGCLPAPVRSSAAAPQPLPGSSSQLSASESSAPEVPAASERRSWAPHAARTSRRPATSPPPQSPFAPRYRRLLQRQEPYR